MRKSKSQALLIILQVIIAVILSASESFPSDVTIFNQTYVRSTGKPVTEEVTIVVPAPAENYRVVVTNGNENGTNRCSSAFADIDDVPMDEVVDIADSDVNGTSIIVPSDLNQNIYIIEKYIILHPVNIFKMTLGSIPGCFLNIKIIGIDWTPPQITITSPGNGAILGSSSTPVSGTINDLYATVTINGVGTQNSGGSFQSNIPLNYGQNNILAQARDFYNNTSSDQITIISDTNAPVITIDPTPELVSGNTIELRGRVEDLTATSVSMQGQSVSVPAGGGAFTFTVNLTEGLNTMVVSAEDSVSNSSVASRIIISDTNSPVIIIDPTLEYISNHTLVLTGSISDLTATTVSIQGQSLSVPAGGGTFSFTVNLAEGFNTLTVSAQDSASNTSEASRTITSDTIAPVVNITVPIMGSFISLNTTDVSGTVTDATPATVKVNGTDAVVSGSTFAITSVSLIEGNNTITATATDAAGNTGTDAVTVVSDTNPPVITIDPTPEYISSHTLVLTGSISDLTATTVSIQGQSVSVPAGGGTFSYTVNLAEGLNTLTVSAQDSASNMSEASRMITSDTIAPVVQITSPITGAFSAENTTAVSGIVTDATPATVKVNGADASVIGITFTVTSVSLAIGNNTIIATATDAAGNIGTDAVTIVSDTNPPVIIIDPTPEYISSHMLLLTGSVSDLTASTVSIQGQSVSVPAGGGTFSYTVNLAEGLNTLTVSAQDSASNTSEASRTITSDTIAPVVDITAPIDGTFIALNAIAVSGTVNDATPATVKVNGADAVVSNSTFATSVSFIDGNNTITAMATDAAGNTGTDEVIVVSDTNPPTIIIDLTPEYISSHTLMLTGNISDLTATTVSIQGQSVSVPAGGGTFSFTVNLTEGLNTLTVSAHDSSGNTSEASRAITSDTIAPMVQITSPITGAFIALNSTAVSGTVTDATPITVSVNGVNATVAGGNFNVVSLSLIEGTNIIIATATDSAGNTETDQITIISDTTPPVVTIDTPADGLKTNTAAQTVTGTVTDASPIDTLLINGIEISQVSGRYETVYNLEEGLNSINVKATDAVGNNSSAAITVTLDTIPPDAPMIDTLPDITNAANITVHGTAEAGSLVKIAGAGEATADSSGRFSITVGLSINAMNTFSITATDGVGNESASTVFFILQDSIAPEVTGFSLLADPKLTLNIPVSITFSEALDASTVNPINITVRSPLGDVSGSISYAGTEAIFTPFTELEANQVFTLTVNTGIKDRAGNALASVFTATFETLRGPTFIIGEVYDDTLGLPIEGAEANILKIGSDVPDPAITTLTDVMGRFSLEYEGAIGDALIVTHKDGFTKAFRLVHIEPNKSVEIFDARLTPVETHPVQAAAGGALEAGDTTLMIPSGALAQDMNISIAGLSQQGMRYRLPLGWSPLYGFDISPWNETLNTPAILSIKNEWSFTNTSQFTVARFDSEMLSWVSGSASISGDYINVEVSTLGQYYLIIPDTLPSAPPLPQSVGETILPSMNTLPDGGTATVEVNPRFVLSKADAQGLTVVVVTTQNVIPSGTPIEARITEKYNLSGGDIVTTEPFIQDITLYGWPEDENDNTLSADFPTTPSKYFPFGRLYYGKVNIDIALSSYGQDPADNVIGDKGGAVSGPGGTGIIVLSSSLTEDTVFSMDPLSESEVPAAGTSDLTFLSAMVLKMQGGTFKPGAYPQFTLSVSITEGTEVILTKVVTIDGKSALTAVATGVVSDGKVTINRCLIFQCISDGRYSFYKPSGPIGLISGAVFKSGVPVAGVVMNVDRLPFKTVTDTSGNFAIVGLAGTYSVKASESGTGLIASAGGTISGGENIIINLDLNPSEARVSAVTPYDRETAVGPDRKIEVTFSVPVDPYTVDNNSFLVLEELPGIKHELVPVEGRISITSGNSKAVFTPEFELGPDTLYHIKLTGQIIDKFGTALVPFESVFTTAEVLGNEALEPGQLKASMPDQDGYVTVRGGPGMAAPGTNVLIINKSQSIVLTVIAEEDGSFEGRIQATIEDELVVEVHDLLGNTTTLSTGLLTDDNGTAAVGPRGGTIYGPGGIKAIIPEGAFDSVVIVTISMLSEDAIQNVQIDSALRTVGVFEIDTNGVEANEELKVSFPAPDWVTAEHQMLVGQVVNVRGIEELTLACPAVLKEGQVQSTSPPFHGITMGGQYTVTTWEHASQGVAYTMVQTCGPTGSYSMGFAGFVFPVPSCTGFLMSFPLTIPVNQPYTVELTGPSGEPLDSVTVYGPPGRGEFTGNVERLSSDIEAPSVTSSSHPDGVGGILSDDNSIVIELSERVDPSTVNKDTVIVKDSTGKKVEGTVYLAKDGKTIVFIPKYGYRYDETYTIAIDGVRDYGKGEGNVLTGYRSTFSTFQPRVIATMKMPHPRNVDAYKDNIVVSSTINSSQSNLVIIDVSDPYNPVIKGETTVWDIVDLKAVPDITVTNHSGQPEPATTGDFVVTVDGNPPYYSAVRLFNVSNPANITTSESVFLSSTFTSSSFTFDRPNVPYAMGFPIELGVIGTNAYVSNLEVGIQAVDITRVSPPKRDAQSALGGTLIDRDYKGVSILRHPDYSKDRIVAVTFSELAVISPQLGVMGKYTGLDLAFNVTGAGAFPIDIDKDGNIGTAEDGDGDFITSAQETFDLAFVSTKQGILVFDVTNPSLPTKIDIFPTFKNSRTPVAVDRQRRLAYVLADGGMSVLTLKDLNPRRTPTENVIEDDRIIYEFPKATGRYRDIVLSEDGTLAFITDDFAGEVKVVNLGNQTPHVDLEISNLPEEYEEDQSAFVLLNDDDNAGSETPGKGNGTPDFNDPAPLLYDDVSLQKVDLYYNPTPLPEGFKIVLSTISGGANVRIWKSAKKDAEIILPQTYSSGVGIVPTEFYVEGVEAGETIFDVVLKSDQDEELFRDSVKVSVVKVEITKIWSNQHTIVDDEVMNYLPNGAGFTTNEQQDYILMGERDDSYAYVKARLNIQPDTAAVRNKLIAKLAKIATISGETAVGPNVSFDKEDLGVLLSSEGLIQNDVVSVRAPIDDWTVYDYVIVVGVDNNQNGILEKEEIIEYSKIGRFKIVTEVAYLYSKAIYLSRDFIVGLSNRLLYPNANNFMDSFTGGSDIALDTFIPFPVNDSRISHHVGFNKEDGTIRKAEFTSSTALSEKILESDTLSYTVRQFIGSNEKRQEVINFFINPANDGDNQKTFYWNISTGINFGYENILSIFPSDLFLAIGEAYINDGVIAVTVNRDLTVSELRIVNARLSDIYDWDYTEGFVFGIEWPDEHGARMQAGYDIYGSAGGIFEIDVTIDGIIQGFEYTFD